MTTTSPRPPLVGRTGTINRSRQAKGATPTAPTKNPSEQPYVPTTLTLEWIHSFYRNTLEQNLQNLGKSLLHDRQLPNFYFRQTLIEEGVDPIRATRWDPSKWVSPNGRVNITDYNQQLLALSAFLRVQRYLSDQPPNETYMQAIKRLKTEIEGLVDNGMSRAEIAKRLELNPKTVSCILREKHTGRTRICPWEIIRKIQVTDWTPLPKNQRKNLRFAEPPTPHSLTDNEVSHSRAKDRAAQKQNIRVRQNQIKNGDPCWKCKASHTHLAPEGIPKERHQEMVCRMCGTSNYMRTGNNQKNRAKPKRRAAA